MQMVARLQGGIPTEFRRTMWLTLADKHLQRRGVDWPQAERLCFSEWSNPDDDELGVQIVKDLHRTGCSMFCGQSNQAVLKRVLLAYARWNKAVGYCQGFNMLAALILQVMDRNEPDSVKVMIYLIEGVLPESYFANNLRGLSVDMAVFRDLLRLRLPQLSRHLENLQMEAGDNTGSCYEPPLTNVFTMQWFLTLFCNCLPQPVVLRVWDLIFLEGNQILLRTALAIWDHLAERIMTVSSADEFYSIMGVLTREILEFSQADSNRLIKTVVAMQCPELPALRDKYMYNITPWTSTVSSGLRRGLRLFYTEDDSGDSGDNSDQDDDERIAVAAAFGIADLFRSPRRRGSVNAGGGGQRGAAAGAGGGAGAGAGPLAMPAPDRERERLSLDVSMLKQQYCRLRERQRQAHIIVTAACGGLGGLGGLGGGASLSGHSVAMNHLLIGKPALRSAKGRRLPPPPGAVPPPPTKAAAAANATKRHSLQPRPRPVETLHWKDEDKRRKSLADGPELPVQHPSRLRPGSADSQRSSGSSSRSRSSSSSSTSTELCDEQGAPSEEEEHADQDLLQWEGEGDFPRPGAEVNGQKAGQRDKSGTQAREPAPRDGKTDVLLPGLELETPTDFSGKDSTATSSAVVDLLQGDSQEEGRASPVLLQPDVRSDKFSGSVSDVAEGEGGQSDGAGARPGLLHSTRVSGGDIERTTHAPDGGYAQQLDEWMTALRDDIGGHLTPTAADAEQLEDSAPGASPDKVVASVTEKLRLIMEHLSRSPSEDSGASALRESSPTSTSSRASSSRESRQRIMERLFGREGSFVEESEEGDEGSAASLKSSALELDLSELLDEQGDDGCEWLAERARSAAGDVEGVTASSRKSSRRLDRQNSERASRIIRENSEILQRISAWQRSGRAFTLPERSEPPDLLAPGSGLAPTTSSSTTSHKGVPSASALLEDEEEAAERAAGTEDETRADTRTRGKGQRVPVDLPLPKQMSLDETSWLSARTSASDRTVDKMQLILDHGETEESPTATASQRHKPKYKFPEMSPLTTSPLQPLPGAGAHLLRAAETERACAGPKKWRPELSPPSTPMVDKALATASARAPPSPSSPATPSYLGPGPRSKREEVGRFSLDRPRPVVGSVQLDAPTALHVQTPSLPREGPQDDRDSLLGLGPQRGSSPPSSPPRQVTARRRRADKSPDDAAGPTTFNPFPSRTTVRQPKDIGVKLGLYPNSTTSATSPTSALASAKKSEIRPS
ncbi:TBC1 domain family member 30 [Frankliniella fusca]|uniref:TBC1 domain family member 30 n=1 Tax=Frankliniella fusca TaxID=407009 RepID=A0AAE1HFG0_9NEOP|nr:TBC1 domain family member 30 [Frankliniella fusca]